jgi:hypothetical protein
MMTVDSIDGKLINRACHYVTLLNVSFLVSLQKKDALSTYRILMDSASVYGSLVINASNVLRPIQIPQDS